MTRFYSLSNLNRHRMGKRAGRMVFGGVFNRLPMHPSRF